MPRLRQRIVYCDCFDCADRPAESTLTPEQLDAATAVARQEPPPKALLIFVTGMLLAADGSTNLDVHTLPHCNLLVREGNLGLLATRGGGDHSGNNAVLPWPWGGGRGRCSGGAQPGSPHMSRPAMVYYASGRRACPGRFPASPSPPPHSLSPCCRSSGPHPRHLGAVAAAWGVPGEAELGWSGLRTASN